MKHHLSNFGKRLEGCGPSRKFFITCLAFIGGVGIHSVSKFEQWNLLWIFVTFIVMAIATIIFFLKLRKLVWLGFTLLAFIGGLILYESSLKITKDDISSLNGQVVALRGVVIEESDVRLDHQKLAVSRITHEYITNNSRIPPPQSSPSFSARGGSASGGEGRKEGERSASKGKLLLRAPLYPEYQYGDEVELRCKLQKPEPVKEFAYDEYLARWNIYSVCYRPDHLVLVSRENGNWFIHKILIFKRYLSTSISAALPEPYGSLARGATLGERGTIPREIQDIWRMVGLSHILAISGFNITIVVTLVGLAVRSIIHNKKARFWITCISIILFVLLVGADASVVRAAIMGSLAILAKSSGRIPPPRITLSLAGVLMLIANPKLFAFDRGFILSFAATIGIIYFTPLLKNYFKPIDRKTNGTEENNKSRRRKEEIGTLFGELTRSTIAAIIFTIPLTTYFFKTISLVAFAANLLVVPITPIIMIASLVVGMLGFTMYLPHLIAPLLYASIYYTDLVSRFFAHIPYASLTLESVHWILLPLSYAAIFYVMWIMKKKITRQELQETVRMTERRYHQEGRTPINNQNRKPT